MKTCSMLTLVSLAVVGGFGCTTQNEVTPVADQRDDHVGLYACEVKIENFNTKEILSSFVDTLRLSKQGDNELVVVSTNNPLPVLQVLSPRAYYGQFTILAIEKGVLTLTTGPDVKFYVYTGHKINP